MGLGGRPPQEGSEQRRVRVFQKQPIKAPAQPMQPMQPGPPMPPPVPAPHVPQMAPPMPPPPMGPPMPAPRVHRGAPHAPPPMQQHVPPPVQQQMPPPVPQAPAPNPRHQEVEQLRQQHGSCIWRVWTRVESGPRIAFAPVYLQVDAEDQDDGTTVIRQYGRSWIFPTAVVDTEVLGIERAIEERWISREEFQAFLFE